MSKSDLKLYLWALPLLMGFFAFLIGAGLQADKYLGVMIFLGIIAGFLADIVVILYNIHFEDSDKSKDI